MSSSYSISGDEPYDAGDPGVEPARKAGFDDDRRGEEKERCPEEEAVSDLARHSDLTLGRTVSARWAATIKSNVSRGALVGANAADGASDGDANLARAVYIELL